MLFRVHRELACGPVVAFGLLTDPAALNRWSTSPIRTESAGDGGHPTGIGALRTIALPGRHGSLEEVVVDAVPPRRLEFRAVGSGVIRGHRTRVELTPRGSERTRVDWHVEVDLRGPLLSLPARLHLGHELASSLDRLVELSSQIRSVAPYPRPRDLDEAPRLPTLRLEAERSREALAVLAKELAGSMDELAGMAEGLGLALDATIRDVREANAYRQPGFVLRLLPPIASTFAANVARIRGRVPDAVAPHYARAFEGTQKGSAARELGRRALVAFAEGELPRLVLELHAASYRGFCDPARFRSDVYDLGERLDAALATEPRRPRLLVPWRAPSPDRSLERAFRTGFERGIAPFSSAVAGASPR